MWQRFLELFERPLGYILLFGIFIFGWCENRYSIKGNRHKGYTEVEGNAQTDILHWAIKVSFIIITIFTICYLFDVRDVENQQLDGHIKLVLTLFYPCSFMYLFFDYQRIFFNKTEIIVYGFLKKKKIYNWEDIIKLVNILGDVTVVVTNKGKFWFSHDLKNSTQFLKLLKEKILISKK